MREKRDWHMIRKLLDSLRWWQFRVKKAYPSNTFLSMTAQKMTLKTSFHWKQEIRRRIMSWQLIKLNFSVLTSTILNLHLNRKTYKILILFMKSAISYLNGSMAMIKVQMKKNLSLHVKKSAVQCLKSFYKKTMTLINIMKKDLINLLKRKTLR